MYGLMDGRSDSAQPANFFCGLIYFFKTLWNLWHFVTKENHTKKFPISDLNFQHTMLLQIHEMSFDSNKLSISVCLKGWKVSLNPFNIVSLNSSSVANIVYRSSTNQDGTLKAAFSCKILFYFEESVAIHQSSISLPFKFWFEEFISFYRAHQFDFYIVVGTTPNVLRHPVGSILLQSAHFNSSFQWVINKLSNYLRYIESIVI
jgi:hypothetical protein